MNGDDSINGQQLSKLYSTECKKNNRESEREWGGRESERRIVAHDVAKISQLIVRAICRRASTTLKRYFDITCSAFLLSSPRFVNLLSMG